MSHGRWRYDAQAFVLSDYCFISLQISLIYMNQTIAPIAGKEGHVVINKNIPMNRMARRRERRNEFRETGNISPSRSCAGDYL
jgi:hypothetical protein